MTLSLAHPLVKYYISAVLALYPAWRICRRFGVNPLLSLSLLVPFFGFVILAGLVAYAGRGKKESVHG